MRALLPSSAACGSTAGSRRGSLFFTWLRVRLGRNIAAEHACAGPLAEGFRLTFFIDGSPDVDIGCTSGGCLSRGEEKGAYRFPSDGEILLDEVDTLSRDPVFLEVLARCGASRTTDGLQTIVAEDGDALAEEASGLLMDRIEEALSERGPGARDPCRWRHAPGDLCAACLQDACAAYRRWPGVVVFRRRAMGAARRRAVERGDGP